MNTREPRDDQRGQTLILAAAAMLAVVAMAALVLDGGFGYLERRRMQNAADAAAFSAADYLAWHSDRSNATENAVLREIHRYAERNGVPDSDGAVENAINSNVRAYFVDEAGAIVGVEIGMNYGIPASAKGAVVQTKRTYPTFFAGLIGFPEVTAAAIAQARYGAAVPADLVPIAIQEDAWKIGVNYTIWASDKTTGTLESGQIAEGNRGWLNLDGRGVGTDLARWMYSGYDGSVVIQDPQWINGAPGAKTGVLQAADNRLTEGRTLVYIPIYDQYGGAPQILPGQTTMDPVIAGTDPAYYHIIGFAAFEITSVEIPGSWKDIKGDFVTTVTKASFSGGRDFGLRTVKLVAVTAALP